LVESLSFKGKVTSEFHTFALIFLYGNETMAVTSASKKGLPQRANRKQNDLAQWLPSSPRLNRQKLIKIQHEYQSSTHADYATTEQHTIRIQQISFILY
jgi:hypothetical protein